ncbi:MAG TPA: nicotinate-nucleotide adenylyltransferase [Sulfuricaulis sp.]
MKPLGILGGTFDPIHHGHLRPAQEIRHVLELAEILVIPAFLPPHRDPPVATAEQRLHMAELAVADMAGFRVDDREIRRRGPSYTVLTLESLREEYGERPLCLLLGVDAFQGIETWHQWERLPRLSNFIVVTRPGWAAPVADDLPPWARDRVAHSPDELAHTAAGRILFQAVTPQNISATIIRAAIAGGKPVDNMLPPAVLNYIRAHQIYHSRNH